MQMIKIQTFGPNWFETQMKMNGIHRRITNENVKWFKQAHNCWYELWTVMNCNECCGWEIKWSMYPQQLNSQQWKNYLRVKWVSETVVCNTDHNELGQREVTTLWILQKLRGSYKYGVRRQHQPSATLQQWTCFPESHSDWRRDMSLNVNTYSVQVTQMVK
jgi:hypothetical protein